MVAVATRVSRLQPILPGLRYLGEPRPMAKLTAKTTGGRIKEAYLRANLNRNQLHKLTGIAYDQIMAWESGAADPTSNSLELVANHTGVTVDDLLGRGDDSADAAEPAAFVDFVQRFGPTLTPALTGEEKRSLLAVRFHRPAPEKYLSVLMMMRDGMSAEVAQASDEATRSARAKGDAAGVKPRRRKS